MGVGGGGFSARLFAFTLGGYFAKFSHFPHESANSTYVLSIGMGLVGRGAEFLRRMHMEVTGVRTG